jgi:hypothetical protein
LAAFVYFYNYEEETRTKAGYPFNADGFSIEPTAIVTI